MLPLLPPTLKQLFQIAIEQKIQAPSQAIPKQIWPEPSIKRSHAAFILDYIAQYPQRVSGPRPGFGVELEPILEQIERMCGEAGDNARAEAR
jgi:hypothetical protein